MKLNLNPQLLLSYDRPKPLSGINPRNIKGKAWWNKIRKQIYKKAGFRCQCCGVHQSDAIIHQWMEAHESYKVDWQNGLAELDQILCLCHACHNFIHRGRLISLWRLGYYSQEYIVIILRHGEFLIKQNGLIIPPEPKIIAPWHQWRLLFEDNLYYSRFENVHEYQGYYDFLNKAKIQDTPEALALFKEAWNTTLNYNGLN